MAAPAVNMADVADITKCPTFYGDASKDRMTAEQFIAKIDGTITCKGYNNAQAMALFERSLAGDAYEWLNFVKRSVNEVALLFNPDVKTRFLEDFRRSNTSNIATGLLEGLQQKPNEDVTKFFIRVTKAFTSMINLKQTFPLLVATAENSGAEFMELTAAQRAVPLAAQRNLTNGQNDEFYQMNFFNGGLRENIRTILLNQTPDGGYQSARQCFQAARKIEMNLGEKAGVDRVVAAVEEKEQEQQQPQHEEVLAFRGRGRGMSRGRGSYRGSNRGRGAAPPKVFSGNCYLCGKPGHRKADCRTHKVAEINPTDGSHATRENENPNLYVDSVSVYNGGENFRHLN